ncbi:hypothetical protein [Rhizobium gallicum]|uniref:hypothetical protein n=1 Tax=Rhizobium gallicum TaxID=56730 RepID=UPI001EF76310|nr:hypothetical protein [Rhizobium gallicum]ULJ73634.1 hypothetical protein L2W42_08700 [Rhizobium gallicum]
MKTYAQAIRELNNAAHNAIRACKDTIEYPMVDRQTLRELAALTDKLFDDAVTEGYVTFQHDFKGEPPALASALVHGADMRGRG